MIKSDFTQVFPDDHGSVHFVGIGGAGMSGIAHLFADAGVTVTGSDIRDTATVAALRGRGVRVAIGHAAENIADAHTLVVSGAIAEDNPEYLAAKHRGLPTVHRARALAWLTSRTRLVAVAGAHGKTTSTAMLVTALLALGQKPGFVNGGVIRALGVSAASGTDELFVVEADESDGSFLLYRTAIALITNVDPDHLDHFGTEQAFFNAFETFARNASEGVVLSLDDAGSARLVPQLGDRSVTTFGQHPDSDARIHSLDLGATASFSIAWAGEDVRIDLRVPGHHNVLNAAGAFTVLVRLGFAPREVAAALETFVGAQRRFEPRGEIGGVRVFDDFAHHPTEVRAALEGARPVAGRGRIVCVFQPHLYSRTRLMTQEFVDAFVDLVDELVIVPIYAAREEPEPGVTGALISERFPDRERARYVEDWDEAARVAAELARPGDIVMTMGGGDVYRVVPAILDELHRRWADV